MNKEEYKKLIIIFLIASSLRMLFFVVTEPWENNDKLIDQWDSKSYHEIALNLLENKVFSSSEHTPYHPNIFRTPLYPFFLMAVYIAFGIKPYIVILFHIVAGSLTCILTYKIGKIMFNEKAALLAGLLVACEYSGIYYGNLLLTETIFTSLFVVHMYFIAQYLMTNDDRALLYSAIMLGLATLCRPISIYFSVFLIGFFLLHFGKNYRQGIVAYSLFILLFLVTISPWMVRNYSLTGNFSISSLQKLALSWHFPDLIKDPKIIKEINAQDLDKDHYSKINKRENVNKKKTLNQNLRNYSIHNAKKHIAGVMDFFSAIGGRKFPTLKGQDNMLKKEEWGKELPAKYKIEIKGKSILGTLVIYSLRSYLILLYAAMILGLVYAIKENKCMPIVLLLSAIVYFAIATSPVLYISARYRTPIMPYIILLSSYGITQLYKTFKEYKAKKTSF